MTGGDVSRGGSHPPFSSLFCLVLISYLSIYLYYLLLYLSVHNHFLTKSFFLALYALRNSQLCVLISTKSYLYSVKCF